MKKSASGYHSAGGTMARSNVVALRAASEGIAIKNRATALHDSPAQTTL